VPKEQIKTKHLLSVEHDLLLCSFIQTYCMFRANNDHHQATNTKSQCKVKYSIMQMYSHWDPIDLKTRKKISGCV
jgi:hypothetical protein